MKRTLLMGVAFAFAAQMAAALTADELATSYAANGYGYIQIKTGTTQIKVEAVKGGQKVETIYDAASGNILKTETYAVGSIVSSDPGVRLRAVQRDFLRPEAEDSAGAEAGHADGHIAGHGRGEGLAANAEQQRPGGRDDSQDERSDDDHGDDDHGDDDHGDDHRSDDHGGGRGRG